MEAQLLQKRERENGIDLMKGFLTLTMIIAHAIQMFPAYTSASGFFSVYVNLTTFSGFMFCLGYVFPLAYSSEERAEKRLFMGMLKTLSAFFVSGVFAITLIYEDYSFESVVHVLLLRKIPSYSEFLLSFCLVYIVCLFLRKQILALLDDKIKLSIIIAITLILTYMRYELILQPVLGSFIGTCSYPSFPIVQYFGYFLIGAYLSKKRQTFNFGVFILAVLGLLLLLLNYVRYSHWPNRFPPSLTWVAGGAFFVYAYFLIFKKVENLKFLSPLSFVGKNSLIFLVVSNIVLFSAKRIFFEKVFTNFSLLWTILFLLSVMLCTITIFIKKYIAKLIKRLSADIKKMFDEQ